MYQTPRRRVNERTTIPPQAPPLGPQPAPMARVQPDRGAEVQPDSTGPEPLTVEMEGVYIISVAARILDMHPQTLRKYERLGLISPGRTLGMLRLYSQEDIRKLRLIRHLVGNLGLNLAGVEFALGAVDNLLRMRQRLLAAAEGTHFKAVVEQEMAQLFLNLNLGEKDYR